MGAQQISSKWLVIGGGLLGASCALRLRDVFPTESVTWILGTKFDKIASTDINKIVRTTYPDDGYHKLAQNALREWQSTDYLAQYFHQVGWVQTISEGSYRSTKKTTNDRIITVDELQQQFGNSIQPDLHINEELWMNDEVGSIDAGDALQAMKQRAKIIGITMYHEDVQKLVVRDGQCVGALLPDVQVNAERTILSAGAWSPSILECSNIAFRSKFFTVAGVVVALLSLRNTEYKAAQNMPILVTEFGEIMVSSLHQFLKVTTTKTFALDKPENACKHPRAHDIEPHRKVLRKMMPEYANRELSTWICLDLMTPDQRPIIDQVENVNGLWLATGGNYHSAKFVNFGDLVVRRITGKTRPGVSPAELDEVLRGCSWERLGDVQPLHPSVIPRHC